MLCPGLESNCGRTASRQPSAEAVAEQYNDTTALVRLPSCESARTGSRAAGMRMDNRSKALSKLEKGPDMIADSREAPCRRDTQAY